VDGENSRGEGSGAGDRGSSKIVWREEEVGRNKGE